MTLRIKVATWNAPHRLRPHHAGLAWADKNGVDVVLCQEHTDTDDWRPDKNRWGRIRPTRAQSNTIYYRKQTMQRKKVGAIRMSSPGFRSYRDLVWAAFRVKKSTPRRPVRIASIHLPAFYTSSRKNKLEYDKQAVKVAKWARGGKNRVVGGDFNGSKGGGRMAPIEKDVRLSKAVPSGPSGQKIDYVGVRRGGTWKVVETERIQKWGSDHAMVVVTLEWR